MLFRSIFRAVVGRNLLIEHLQEIRQRHGETGSQQFSSYQALSTFQSYTGKRYIIWNGSELMGLGNEKLKWQVTKQLNGGVEVGLFDGRLSASFDIYSKKTSNLLSQMDLPLANGLFHFEKIWMTAQNCSHSCTFSFIIVS